MTDKLYMILKAPGQTKRELKGVQVEINNLKVDMMPSGINYNSDKIQSSPHDSMSEYANRLIQLEQKEISLRDKYAMECKRVDMLIDKLEDIDQVNVIKARYIIGYRFEQIAKVLNFSESQTYKLHRLGVKHLDIVLQEIG